MVVIDEVVVPVAFLTPQNLNFTVKEPVSENPPFSVCVTPVTVTAPFP